MVPSPKAAAATLPLAAMLTAQAVPGAGTFHLSFARSIVEAELPAVPRRKLSPSGPIARLLDLSKSSISSFWPSSMGS